MLMRRNAVRAISSDEQMARYAFALGHAPASVADKAYAAAFRSLSAAQREEIVGQLNAELMETAKIPASVDPAEFGVLMRDLMRRSALVRIRDAAVLAAAFVASPSVIAYFTTGAGSVTIEHLPLWIHELAGHETAPMDGGRMHHRHGAPGFAGRDHENSGDSREW